MSDVLKDDDMHALAAEYVLGTLEADERVRAHAMLDVDHGFRAMVRIWERRFSELHLMVEPVDPPPQVWDRIKAQLPTITPLPSEPAPTVLPAAAAPVSPVSEEKPAETTEVPTAVTAEGADQARTEEGADQARTADQPRTEEEIPVIAAEMVEDEGPGISTSVSAMVEAEKPIPAPRRAVSDRAVGASLGADVGVGAWRAVAVAMTVLVVALLALGAAWKFAPQRLPGVVQSLFQPNGGSPSAAARRPPPAFEE